MLIGSFTMALVATFAPLTAQLGVLGAFSSILGGLFIGYVPQEEDRDRWCVEIFDRIAISLSLALEEGLHLLYLAYCESLTALAKKTDPLLREIAARKLASAYPNDRFYAKHPK